jgi:hypothetical protein
VPSSQIVDKLDTLSGFGSYMTRIKLSTDSPNWPYLRQTPDSKGIWGDCTFFVNTEVDECDWWFIYEGLVRPETTKCDPQHIVLITGEPPITRTYDPLFLSQFSTVITSHSDIAHPNTILRQQALPWYVGIDKKTTSLNNTFLTYNSLNQLSSGNLSKLKLVSVISSNKKYTRGHRYRLRFVERLISRLGNKVDFYGDGFNNISDKWNAIAPYKYHIVLENSSVPHYFTEKLSDAFLGWSYPIYYGCPNIFDYFPEFSLTNINILDLDQSIDTIEKVIYSDTFERRLTFIEQARKLVLNRHNLFAVLAEFSNCESSRKKTEVQLYPESYNGSFNTRVMKMYRKFRHYGLRKMTKVFFEQQR